MLSIILNRSREAKKTSYLCGVVRLQNICRLLLWSEQEEGLKEVGVRRLSWKPVLRCWGWWCNITHPRVSHTHTHTHASLHARGGDRFNETKEVHRLTLWATFITKLSIFFLNFKTTNPCTFRSNPLKIKPPSCFLSSCGLCPPYSLHSSPVSVCAPYIIIRQKASRKT